MRTLSRANGRGFRPPQTPASEPPNHRTECRWMSRGALVMGLVVIAAVMFILGLLISDILYTLLDPRIRLK